MSLVEDVTNQVIAITQNAFTAEGLTVSVYTDPQAFDVIPADDFPASIVIFGEEDPERLDFKQERRRVFGTVALSLLNTEMTERAQVDDLIEGIRDGVFADPYLSGLVDDIVAEAGVTVTNPEASKAYGSLEITAEVLR
jgi:hypothetical protein